MAPPSSSPLKKHHLTLLLLFLTPLHPLSLHHPLSTHHHLTNHRPAPQPTTFLHLHHQTPRPQPPPLPLPPPHLPLLRPLPPSSSTLISLHIYIDHFPITPTTTTDVGLAINSTRELLAFVDAFQWPHGPKLVHYRTLNVGLQAQWLESWWPAHDHESVLVLEDDLEVSPHYYNCLKRLIIHYYYDPSNFSPWIFGATLQRPRFVPGKHGNKMNLDNGTGLFLYPLVGTWGQLLFPKPWK